MNIEQGISNFEVHYSTFDILNSILSRLDILVSWNFEHIVKLKTKIQANAVNVLLGYNPIEIIEPGMF